MRIKLFLLIYLGSIGSIYGMSKIANEMLLEGIVMGNIELVKEAIENGADVNTKKGQDTALMMAARNDNEDVARLLLDAKADCNMTDDYSSTPLMIAVRRGKENLVKLFLRYGADPDIKSRYGDVALLLAAYGYGIIVKMEDILKLLLDAGASLDIMDKQGLNVLDTANKKKDKSLIELLEAEYKKREEKRQQVNKEIVESGYLLPDLASIVSEYAVCAKQKGGGK